MVTPCACNQLQQVTAVGASPGRDLTFRRPPHYFHTYLRAVEDVTFNHSTLEALLGGVG